jgi:hypothetical protein
MSTKKVIIVIAAVILILTLLSFIAYSLLWQQSTNDNHGELPSTAASLFIYTINDLPYKHGDTIDWGIMEYGTNSVVIRVINIHTDPITISFLNGTMPQGWVITVTNNNAEVEPFGNQLLTVTIDIPETEQGIDFNWETTLYAEVATS